MKRRKESLYHFSLLVLFSLLVVGGMWLIREQIVKELNRAAQNRLWLNLTATILAAPTAPNEIWPGPNGNLNQNYNPTPVESALALGWAKKVELSKEWAIQGQAPGYHNHSSPPHVSNLVAYNGKITIIGPATAGDITLQKGKSFYHPRLYSFAVGNGSVSEVLSAHKHERSLYNPLGPWSELFYLTEDAAGQKNLLIAQGGDKSSLYCVDPSSGRLAAMGDNCYIPQSYGFLGNDADGRVAQPSLKTGSNSFGNYSFATAKFGYLDDQNRLKTPDRAGFLGITRRPGNAFDTALAVIPPVIPLTGNAGTKIEAYKMDPATKALGRIWSITLDYLDANFITPGTATAALTDDGQLILIGKTIVKGKHDGTLTLIKINPQGAVDAKIIFNEDRRGTTPSSAQPPQISIMGNLVAVFDGLGYGVGRTAATPFVAPRLTVIDLAAQKVLWSRDFAVGSFPVPANVGSVFIFAAQFQKPELGVQLTAAGNDIFLVDFINQGVVSLRIQKFNQLDGTLLETVNLPLIDSTSALPITSQYVLINEVAPVNGYLTALLTLVNQNGVKYTANEQVLAVIGGNPASAPSPIPPPPTFPLPSPTPTPPPPPSTNNPITGVSGSITKEGKIIIDADINGVSPTGAWIDCGVISNNLNVRKGATDSILKQLQENGGGHVSIGIGAKNIDASATTFYCVFKIKDSNRQTISSPILTLQKP